MPDSTFNQIRTIQLAVSGERPATKDELINFQTSAIFGISGLGPEAKLVIRWNVAITSPPKNDGSIDRIYGHVVTESYFILPEIELYREAKGYRIPKDLVIPLVEAASSTTRGILLSRAAGTALDNMPLPLLDGSKMLEAMETVDIPVPEELLSQLNEMQFSKA